MLQKQLGFVVMLSEVIMLSDVIIVKIAMGDVATIICQLRILQHVT